MSAEASPVRLWSLRLLACLAMSIIVGAAYTFVSPQLAPYAPVALSGYWFVAITALGTVALGFALGHQHPRLVIASSFVVATLGSAVYGAMLALPAITPDALNIIGLVNFALTQAAVTFFIIVLIAFPAAIAGLLMSFLWHDR